MNVLFLCADFPWPPNGGGRVRALAQLRLLASLPEVDHVTLFTLSEDVASAPVAELAAEIPKVRVLAPVFHPIHLFRHRRYVPRVAWLRLRGVPYLAGKWESGAVRAALERTLAAERFDVVWLTSLGLARYLATVRRRQPHASVVLDGHNVESEIWRQFAASRSSLLASLARAEWRAATGFERDALREADAVAAISTEDAAAYGALAGVPATFVPQVVSFARRGDPGAAAPRFCYVGTLSWRPNVRGLDWLCAEVWPRVRERAPDATLVIAGSGLPTGADGAPVAPPSWRVPGVHVRGFVPDLDELYAGCAALVAPHLEGTGVRMKLLEAFRGGIPVVTTPPGASGLAITPGHEALVESDARAFADALVALANDAARQRELREAAYAYLERAHSLESARAALREVLERARAARGATSAAPGATDRSHRIPLAFPGSRTRG